jgi:hypothetical protein
LEKVGGAMTSILVIFEELGYCASFKNWLSFFVGLAVLIAVKGNCARRALKKNSNS